MSIRSAVLYHSNNDENGYIKLTKRVNHLSQLRFKRKYMNNILKTLHIRSITSKKEIQQLIYTSGSYIKNDESVSITSPMIDGGPFRVTYTKPFPPWNIFYNLYLNKNKLQLQAVIDNDGIELFENVQFTLVTETPNFCDVQLYDLPEFQNNIHTESYAKKSYTKSKNIRHNTRNKLMWMEEEKEEEEMAVERLIVNPNDMSFASDVVTTYEINSLTLKEYQSARVSLEIMNVNVDNWYSYQNNIVFAAVGLQLKNNSISDTGTLTIYDDDFIIGSTEIDVLYGNNVTNVISYAVHKNCDVTMHNKVVKQVIVERPIIKDDFVRVTIKTITEVHYHIENNDVEFSNKIRLTHIYSEDTEIESVSIHKGTKTKDIFSPQKNQNKIYIGVSFDTIADVIVTETQTRTKIFILSNKFDLKQFQQNTSLQSYIKKHQM